MKLGVNVDHVATLRQARGGKFPDPVEAARICKRAGAHSIVMHLREDRRHIRDRDVFRLRGEVPIRFNLEMSVAPSVVRVAKKVRPEQATLVPERRQERTTEGGLDLFSKPRQVLRCIRTLKERGVEVSLFIDPDLRQIDAAEKMGADAVEFHTGDYANAKNPSAARKQLLRLRKASSTAREMRLTAHAGHGLDYENVRAVTKIRGLVELNIGYSIVTRAVWVGLDRAVREMLELVR